MALPIANSAIYTLKVPSTGQEVKYRPFLVKEQTSLLLAEQSEDFTVIVDTIKSVIEACTFGKVDIESLALFDIEYIMIQLRSKSVGEVEQVNVPCKECGETYLLSVDFSELKVDFPEGHTNKFQLFDDVGIAMKYPGVKMLDKLSSNIDISTMTDVVAECIDYIYDSAMMYPAKDNQDELKNFIDNLPVDAFAKLESFFKTIPNIKHTFEFDCKCGAHNVRVVEGLESFFQ